MTSAAKLMIGITLLTVPTIQYGGYFLLRSLIDPGSGYMANPLRQNLFRAGHAHAGVLVILSLLCQLFVDHAQLPTSIGWLVRAGVPVSAILLPMGFFFSVLSPSATKPSRAIYLVYAGAIVLLASVVTLGIGVLAAV
jgi:hypothetical protein